MKLGIWLPAVAAHPRFPTPDWERTAGVTTLLPRILSQSAGHYTDQLAALAALVSGEDL